MNRIDRLTGTILLLQGRQMVTAAQIAAHWEVSERTVYRDLAALAEAGVPIQFVPERGYTVMPGFHLPPIQFTDQEAAALFTSSAVTERLGDRSLRETLRSALTKIGSVLPEERRDYIARLRQSVGVWPVDPPPSGSVGEFIPIHDAILRRRCLVLRYDSGGRGSITVRTVEPLGLLYYADRWHLIAYCRLREDFRDFRLDRVVGLEIRDETYRAHVGFSIDAFLEAEIAQCALIPVSVTMDADLRDRFRRELLGAPGSEEPLPDGRVRITVLAYSLDHFAVWLLGFGPRLKVESPPELCRAIRETAARIANLYPAD